ncbi:GNAT family N-acetyltransferase [Paenibacillus guangzhouensis]|uniref:GNAT family N-acetyltransferase n=1 Tax=Paenibacillus guangzhouensis TaxID=1473112 RepID=UPI001266DA2D|nr:GNAT family N-acetyltransferase [Paenibacillus guangzhouensis]
MEIRTALLSDLEGIVRLLVDDELGISRERFEIPIPQAYIDAFSAIEKQIGNSIIVAIDNKKVIGCLQLTFIPGLARFGMTRAQIEGVRVDKLYRRKGIGEALFRHAIDSAKAYGCGLIQLTTDKKRDEAHRFYERLGFVSSHEGMKLALTGLEQSFFVSLAGHESRGACMEAAPFSFVKVTGRIVQKFREYPTYGVICEVRE